MNPAPPPTPDAAPVPTARVGSAAAMTDVALVATFAALVAVCAILPAIPVGGLAVPITLQTFGVMLAGAVLGPRRGALAVLLYLGVGFAGLPVFARGGAGLGVLGGPSAGYLLAFPIAAALAGFLVYRALRAPVRRPWLRTATVFACCMAASLLVVHPLGITVMGWRTGLSTGEAILAGATFLPGDVIKNLVAAIVVTAVHRAFPDLLLRRPGRPAPVR